MSGDRPAQARLHRKMAVLHWKAGQRELARHALESRPRAPRGSTGEHIELAHLYQEMGRLLFRSGDSHGAIAWAERALAQAERLTSASGVANGGSKESRRTRRLPSRTPTTPSAWRWRGWSGWTRRYVTSSGASGVAEAPRPAPGRLPRLREPQRSVQHASTRAGPSRRAGAVSSWRSGSGTRPSSRGSTRISRWRTARSRTGATATGWRRRRRRSSSTASSASWTISPCR